MTEEDVQAIWKSSRQRHRPFALIERDGKIVMIAAEDLGDEPCLGVYDKPSIRWLREDLLGEVA